MAKKYKRQLGQRETEKPNKSGKRRAVKRSSKQQSKEMLKKDIQGVSCDK